MLVNRAADDLAILCDAVHLNLPTTANELGDYLFTIYIGLIDYNNFFLKYIYIL